MPAGEEARKRRAQIVDFRPVLGQPFVRGSRFPLEFRSLEKVLMIFAVAARNYFQLTTFDELLQRECVYRLEQPVACGIPGRP